MRRKLYFGVALATFAIVVGGLALNQTIGAQDAPTKVDAAPKKGDQDLFDILRQKFEAKSDGPVLPPLPTAQVQPPPPSPLPIPPPAGIGTLPPLPGPTAQPTPVGGVPLPVQQPPPSPMPIPPAAGIGTLPPLPGPTAQPTPVGEKAKEVQLPVQQPPLAPGSWTLTPPSGVGTLPPMPGQGVPLPAPNGASPVPDQPKSPYTAPPTGATPPLQQPPSDPTPPPLIINQPKAPAVDPAPTPMPLNEPIKLKGSAWSLYVEMVNGQTVVTATVHKKHEFKIVCQHVDLQTGAGVMKAKGKVQISGDALDGSCDQLTLPLHDDRLVLEGGAEVRIQKVTTNVSDAKPAAFELKGDKLDLRISELQSSGFIETSWRKVAGDASEGKTVAASIKPGEWTTYGKLRNIKSPETNVWSLVGSDGKVIVYVMARDGGSLDQYVGRTIAVFGAREGDRGGYPLMRVTHIAVP